MGDHDRTVERAYTCKEEETIGSLIDRLGKIRYAYQDKDTRLMSEDQVTLKIPVS